MTDSQFPKTEFKPKSIRSYVIRSGRATAGQKHAFDRYWPQFGLSLQQGRLDPHTAFALPAPLVVEIGFGMGDSLLQMAAAQPQYNFLGIEVHPPGVGRLINEGGKQQLSNLKVYMADAIDVFTECLPDACIERLQIYFPDPWHKKKHHKRRLIQPAFLQQVAPKIREGGLLHVATDWQPYAEYIMDVLQASPYFVNELAAGQFAPRPEFRPITKFEQRGARLGHGVWDLLFRRDGKEIGT